MQGIGRWMLAGSCSGSSRTVRICGVDVGCPYSFVNWEGIVFRELQLYIWELTLIDRPAGRCVV